MALPIPEEKITEIRHATDIVDIVSESVMLKKAGKNLLGLCPFHAEKTPSFTVSPDKQIFHCFGCGVGGNVFSFLMKHQGVTFPEAVRMLADRYGVDLPRPEATAAQRRALTEREQLLAVNQEAMGFFQRCLGQGGPGRRAKDYLDRRGIAAETIERFELGYAPPGWDNLLRFLTGRRVAPALAEKAGLAVGRRDTSGHYDRFRDRIIFPIRDANGRVVGFGGRVMGDDLPKYLNSPETPVYNKGRVLYGLDRAKAACRQARRVFVVEGYFDAIALFQVGIENTVATLGTALTADHIRLLKGYVERAVLVFDSDAAGVKAAERSIPLFVEAGMEAAVLVLPEGDDPDTYVRRRGREAFDKLADKALGIIAFLTVSAVARHGQQTVEGKVRVINDMLAPLSAVSDTMARSLHIRDLAARLDVDESALLARVREFSGNRGRVSGPGERTLQTVSMSMAAGKGSRLERQIVAMMLQHPQAVAEVSRRRLVDRFEDPGLKKMGMEILAQCAETPRDASEIVQHITDDALQGQAAALAMEQVPWNDQGWKVVMTQYEAVRPHRNDDDLLAKIRTAEADNDFELLTKLLKDKQHRASNRQEPIS
ncbi:MAG: DNA primase [Desulfobacterales bacterium]|nr:DNA primase [Desulfobacterales bacterium]